ncbi:class I SAM-dependent methyltransferase [Salinimonas lutimaris]|uniref:class I SAM-dependent methyltransferase n=1 Tax=Salinimonas lutimaris TaxID=914153 RepID=UPI0010C0D3D5|nr:class I SAM-dependent methyltransferase [Salinimonas lutimaris]
MDTPDIVPVFIAGAASDDDCAQAHRIAQKWSFNVVTDQPEALALQVTDGRLNLKDFREPRQQGVFVDFMDGAIQYRRQHGGGRKEPIAKAIGIKGEHIPSVVDATPGLGRDAFVLAALGCVVTMVERSVVVAALLDDGLTRLAAQEPELATRFTLIHGNSIEVLADWPATRPDAIYLDPMFPHRKKSALVKKEMKVFQSLLGEDPDADALLAPARKLALKRVVVKRPNSAPTLAEQPASMAITSKKHRFDVYLA